jgi:chromate transporter
VAEAATANDAVPSVPFRDALRYWTVLGFVNFGGPTGQIAMMHRDLVDRRRWISEERFLHALNYCVLLPGPEAQQLAIYVGWLLHGTKGGLVAGIGFVLPSVFILLALSWIYVAYGSVPLVAALFYGLKPAVVAVVVEAVIRIGTRALKTRLLIGIAAASFLGNVVLGVPFPVIVAAAGLLGFALGRTHPALVGSPARTAAGIDDLLPVGNTSAARALRVILVCVALWILPIALLAVWRGSESVLVQEALFFSRAAMVTFGGAYAVLGYIRDVAVGHYGWLAAGQMIDGLGLAETTPGPLIMVTQFVGFLGAWNHPEGLPPAAAGVLGALITTWVTFVPCFLWIFLGAPYIERLRGNRELTAALSAVTAAVVGVILNLAVVFAVHTFFPPAGGVDVFAVAVAIGAFVALQRWHMSMPAVIATCAALGVAARLMGLAR